MPATLDPPKVHEPDRWVELHRISWDQYTTIGDALVDRHNPRMIYVGGWLTLLTTSRRHNWLAERFGCLVVAVAHGCGIRWDDAGQATFRREDRGVGVEGDKTFYFGNHADLMIGGKDIDLWTQPPPDLVIEVETSYPADLAMAAWGWIGVPEVWRFDDDSGNLSLWRRRRDATYERTDRSAGLPMLTPAEIVAQVRMAESLVTSTWYAQLGDWVRNVLVPRLDQAR